uniref:Uncharacterized protein n=1 Tax=Arundo donax TaxID=35708 RepID=A0A0A9C0V7_ARUDO
MHSHGNYRSMQLIWCLLSVYSI